VKRYKKYRKFFNKIVKLIEVNVAKVIVLYCKKYKGQPSGVVPFCVGGEKVNIINKSINELKPYDKNPRKNDNAVKYVAESIKQFGFKVPIIVDKNNIIVAGHTRYKAAKKLHIDEVPCIIADDLTDEQIKAFRLADNKVAEKAEWDFDLLGNELDDLFDFDMTVFGFDNVLKEKEVTEDNYEVELPSRE
jgi:ParB-like chromosome segregation protein Spo0J